MEKNEIKLLYEIIENSQMVNKMLISSEICMNNGELLNSQKHTKEASRSLLTMEKDVFKEFFQFFNIITTDKNTYDIPTPLEICKNISSMCFNISMLLGLEIENQSATLVENCLNKIAKDINTIIDLNTVIFNN